MSLCDDTPYDWYNIFMEELIKKITEACYYIPGTYTEGDNVKKGVAIAYTKGLVAGREQALRILRGGESLPR